VQILPGRPSWNVWPHQKVNPKGQLGQKLAMQCTLPVKVKKKDGKVKVKAAGSDLG